jgi:hypothetical protein
MTPKRGLNKFCFLHFAKWSDSPNYVVSNVIKGIYGKGGFV